MEFLSLNQGNQEHEGEVLEAKQSTKKAQKKLSFKFGEDWKREKKLKTIRLFMKGKKIVRKM